MMADYDYVTRDELDQYVSRDELEVTRHEGNTAYVLYWVEDGMDYTPQKEHENDAGFDLRCAEDEVRIPAGGRRALRTGLHMTVQYDMVAMVMSRSGLAVKHGIEAGAGVIDGGYTGEIHVLLHNFGDKEVVFHKGDRIAQLVILKMPRNVQWTLIGKGTVQSSDGRGDSGFGSTGLQ